MNGGEPQGAPRATPGWYPDPWHRAALRFWAGRSWEPWASDGHAVWADARPTRRALGPRDVAALRVVDEVFLPEARARGLVTVEQQPLLEELVRTLSSEAASRGGQVVATSVGQRWAPQPAAPQQQLAQHPFLQQPFPQHPFPVPRRGGVPRGGMPQRTPSALAQWAARARVAVGSDLAVHGLAYLGVLLLFTGLFGLVAFAFADVTPGLRPVAELAGVVVPFVAARVLLRHGAGVVGRSLEVVGGLLVAVMVVTSVLDDFPVPPDLQGAPLRAVLTGACLATGAAYALWARAHRESGLRYLAAPMVWFAAAMAAMGIGRAIPSGEAVAVPTSAQLSAMAIALVLTVAAARRRPEARLAGPTSTAALPGVVVVAVLAELTWAAEAWPAGPVVVTGVMVVLALLLLAHRLPGALVDVGVPLWWTLVLLALLRSAPGPVVATVAAVGFLLLLEHAGLRRRPDVALALPAAGLLVGAVLVWDDPRWAAAVTGVLAAWAVLRRTRPYAASSGWATVLDVAAAALPGALVVAVWSATTLAVGTALAAVVVAAATVPALGHGLQRSRGDRFWRSWWQVALPVAAVAGTLGWTFLTSTTERWVAAASLLVLAVSGLRGPVRRPWRPWVVTGLATGAWVMAASAGSFPTAVLCGGPGAAALAMVVAAHRGAATVAPGDGPPPGGARGTREHAAVGLAGHGLAVLAVGLAGHGWDRFAAVVLATAGLAWTAGSADRGRSPVGDAIGHLGPVARLPWVLALVGAPWAVWVGLCQGSPAVATSHPWTATALLAATALAYAAAARLAGPLARNETLAWLGFAAALLAVAAADAPWVLIGALGAVIVSVVLVPVAHRAVVMRWVAWLALAPMLGLVADRLLPWFAALPTATAVALTSVVVGGALVVLTVALDTAAPVEHGRRWVARRTLRRPELAVVLAVGAVESLVGLGLTPATPVVPASLLVLAVGVVVLAVGLLARAGVLGGLAVLLTWVGAWSLARAQTQVGPLLGVVVTAALLVLAEAVHRLPERRWWSRWDVSVLVAAVPVAVTALAGALVDGGVVRTFVLVGLMAAASGIRLRHRPPLAEVVAWVGTSLVLVGAALEGAGWLALALLVLAAAHTSLAVRSGGRVRAARQAIGVAGAVAAWIAALGWFAWSAQRSVDATAAVAGAAVLLAAVVARLRVDRSWALAWGGAAALVVAGATIASHLSQGGAAVAVRPGAWVVAGLGAVAVSTLTSAAPLNLPVLRHLGAPPLLAAILVGLGAARAGLATRVAVLSALAALLAVVTLALVTRRPGGPWVRPSAELGAAVALLALLIAATPGDLALLATAGAAAAVQAAAGGVALRSFALQVLAVCLACCAWVAFASQAAQHGPYGYTVAIGLALLTVVGLWRRDRRTRGEDVAAPEVVALEMVAVAFLVGAPFVLAVVDSVAHALVALGLGLVLAGWGAVTRVRRRVASGAVVALASLVALVAVPLVALLPSWGGAGLWLLIAAVGLVAVLVATFVERGRTVARSTRARVEEVTVGWE